MNNKKHIDRIFQEKLKNFEAMPDDAVWENIQNTLQKDKRKRRVIPLWWQVAGIAALLALLFTVGNVLFTNDFNENKSTNSIVDTEKSKSENQNQDNNSNNSISNSNEFNSNDSAVSDANSEEADTNNTSKNSKLPIQVYETNQRVVSSETLENSPNSNKTSENESSQKDIIQNKTSNKTSKKEVLAQSPSNLPEPNQKNSVHSPLENNKDADAIINSIKNNTNSAVTNTTTDNTSEVKKDAIVEDVNALIEEKTIEDAIAKANSIDEEEKIKPLNRWSISPNVAPVYFNSLGEGSTIHSQFVQNSKSTEVNMSYGIGGSYAINNKLKIRAGINKVSLGYGTSNVFALNDADGVMANNSGIRNISFNSNSQDDNFMSVQNINLASAPEVFKTNLKGSLDQQFGYIEVPLEVEYSIINKKFGLNVIGGFSTLFLNENRIYSVVEGHRTLLGEATNINDMSYSANFGLGFNYHISDKLKLNLEPMFKYQINTFNNTSGDFQPYFIGVYSGFSFKF